MALGRQSDRHQLPLDLLRHGPLQGGPGAIIFAEGCGVSIGPPETKRQGARGYYEWKLKSKQGPGGAEVGGLAGHWLLTRVWGRCGVPDGGSCRFMKVIVVQLLSQPRTQSYPQTHS